MNDVVVFSGSAHPALADRICSHLGVTRSPVDIKRFSNDCLQAQLLANCRQRDVYIVQPLVPPTQEHLMELLLMIDAARGASAAQITAVMPHYAYARSDKKDASRISLGGRLVADMISTAGCHRVLTMALHAPQVHGFFSTPVDHLTAIGVLADHFRDNDLDDSIVVSPDLGNAKVATQFARLLGLPVAAGSKQRVADDRVVIDSIVGDVSGRRAIILDDEIATGGSMLELMDRLKDAGATEAAIVCTHGLFAGKAVERLRDHPFVTEVVTTDTVPAPRRLARAQGAVGVGPLRRGDQPDPPRPLGQLALRGRRPDPRAAAGQAPLRHALMSRPRLVAPPCGRAAARRRARRSSSRRSVGRATTSRARCSVSCRRPGPSSSGPASGGSSCGCVRRSWPLDVAPGVTVWFATVLVGMLLRHAVGSGHGRQLRRGRLGRAGALPARLACPRGVCRPPGPRVAAPRS